MNKNIEVKTNLDGYKDRISKMNAHEFAEFIKGIEVCDMCVLGNHDNCGYLDIFNKKGSMAANKLCIKNIKNWLKQDIEAQRRLSLKEKIRRINGSISTFFINIQANFRWRTRFWKIRNKSNE